MSGIILCDSDGKQTEMLWEFVFDINPYPANVDNMVSS